MDHYYSKNPESKERHQTIRYDCNGKEFIFCTNSGVFSKQGIDYGTQLIIETILKLRPNLNGNLLDVGCGYGPIGITLGCFNINLNVDMVDINSRAVELAKYNSINNSLNEFKVFESDGFAHVQNDYDFIVTNPPIRAGKKTIFSIFEDAYKHLKNNGEIFVVIQKKQGADSTTKRISEIFGNHQVLEKSAGYRIISAIKNV